MINCKYIRKFYWIFLIKPVLKNIKNNFWLYFGNHTNKQLTATFNMSYRIRVASLLCDTKGRRMLINQPMTLLPKINPYSIQQETHAARNWYLRTKFWSQSKISSLKVIVSDNILTMEIWHWSPIFLINYLIRTFPSIYH